MRAMTHDHRNSFTVEDRLRDRAESLQRERFGGFHFGAAFFGWLVANSVGILLITLLSAIGGAVALTTTDSANQLTGNAATIGVISAILLLAALSLAYYAGGYVAGRMARFDGARQGFGAWLIGLVITVILSAVGAALGANYNLLQQVNLPSIPVGAQSFTEGGLITLLLAALLTAFAAIAGGKVGERFHHKVDEAGGHLGRA